MRLAPFSRPAAPIPPSAVSQENRESREVTFPFDFHALRETLQAARESTIRPWVEAYAETGKPVLALRGETSTVWSREDFEAEKAFFTRFPRVEFHEFPGTGHGLPFEKRRELVELLKRSFRA
jgi:pimeloyl-ACP methyl ester carboxylesterase